MNDSSIQDIFNWIKQNNIIYSDSLKVEEIYNTYKDALKRYNYIRLNFRKWTKQFDLDNPRENYFNAIVNGFSGTLKGANSELLEKIDYDDTLRKLKKK